MSELEDLDRQRSSCSSPSEPARRLRPDGYSDEDALELRRWASRPSSGHPSRPRGAELGRGASGGGLERPGFDLERGARVSGAVSRTGGVRSHRGAACSRYGDRPARRNAFRARPPRGAGAGVRDVRHGLSADRRGQLCTRSPVRAVSPGTSESLSGAPPGRDPAGEELPLAYAAIPRAFDARPAQRA